MTSSLHFTRILGACVPALAAALLLQGCSFIFVDTPPTVHDASTPPSSIHCTTSAAAPVVDTVVAVFEAVRTGIALGADDSDYHSYPISRGADIAIGLGLTTLFTAAATYGYINTSKCSDVKEEAHEPPPPRMMLYRPAPTLRAFCSYDAQCKGDRICENGRCVSPPPPRTPPPEQTPTEPEPAPSAPPQMPAPGGGGEV
jgi:hypothetical protein